MISVFMLALALSVQDEAPAENQILEYRYDTVTVFSETGEMVDTRPASDLPAPPVAVRDSADGSKVILTLESGEELYLLPLEVELERTPQARTRATCPRQTSAVASSSTVNTRGSLGSASGCENR